MSDLDIYVSHCYDLLLKAESTVDDEALCACANLVDRDDSNNL